MNEVTRVLNIFISQLINPFLGILIGVALLLFIWGIIEFMYNADNEEARAKGRSHMIWGILGLFIMVSVWGIIAVLENFVGSFR